VSIVARGWEDDDTLFAALKQAVRARRDVPPEFVEAGKSAFAWHNIDAELAQLTYDSVRDSELASSVRTESASIRALTFSSAHLTIELDVTLESLVGQVIPAQSAVITIQPSSGVETVLTADEIGSFSIRPIPAAAFRLRCQAEAGIDVLTGWITL
jgi:hypothetical protein